MVIVVTLALFALAPPSFDAAKGAATKVESVPKTVSILVGDCSKAEFEDAVACEENIKTARAALKGKASYVYLGVPPEGLLRFEGMKGAKARFVWTPIYDARGLALTIGKPSKLDKNGHPVLKNFVVDVTLADGVLDTDVQRALRTGSVAIELVGRFDGTWSLGRADAPVRGAAFAPTAIRFLNAKNGKPLGEATL